MNTDYNLYKIFLYLFEEKSISKTANRLYVSQPAISYSLKELENQLGYTLFYRNSKGIEPTIEAKELYSYISTAFNILTDAEEHIKNLNKLNTGCIRIGIPSYLGAFFLTPFIREFRKEYPGITFEILTESSAVMREMLETRKLDLVFDILPIDTKKNIQKTVVFKFHNCFAYDKNKFSNLVIKKIEDLSEYPIILPGKNSSLRQKLDECIESKNTTLQPTMVVSSVMEMLNMVREGLGIGYFVKELLLEQKDQDSFGIVSFHELPTVDVCALCIDDFLTTATRKFIEKIKGKE